MEVGEYRGRKLLCLTTHGTHNKFIPASLCFTVALEVCQVSVNLVPLKSLIQGSACQVLKKTDLAIKVCTT